MASLVETSTGEGGIYQREASDPVLGSSGGVSNPQQLANRTKCLKDAVDVLQAGVPSLATQAYVQNELAKLDNKQGVCAGTTANITLSGTQTIDVSLNTGDRVLVKNQSTDADDNAKVTTGLVVRVSEGTAQAGTIWKLTTNDPFTLDSTALEFVDITTGYAPLNSPALTGTPTGITAASGHNAARLATTAFVVNAVDGLVSVNVAGGSDVTLTAEQGGAGIIELTGTISANINLNLPAGSGQYLISNKTSGTFNITAGR